MSLFRTKPIGLEDSHGPKLIKVLTAFDLTLFGIGAIIGAGIFVLTGIAAATKAGPAIVLSYVLAGFACAFSALSYAELAASIGGCGSAYGYAYASFGELIAWVIGWDLILEYSVSVSAVAIGWSGYVDDALQTLGFKLPVSLTKGPLQNGIINLPAFLIILFLSLILAWGVRASARFNTGIVLVKLIVIAIFIGVAVFNVNPANWHPFMPFGWNGVVRGAALIFFAYIGFDAVSTAAEEAINPQRTLPIGIIASLIVCTLVYVIVSGLLTGITPYATLNVPSPVSNALLSIGQHLAAGFIAAGAIAGLTTVMLVMYYGLTRVFLAMARDGLLPPVFAQVNAHTNTPVRIILVGGVVMSLISGFVPISDVAELVNIGTLAAFVLVCVGVVILRYNKPDMLRPFKIPFSPIIPVLGAVSCFYLMLSLPGITWARFVIWMILGFVVYFTYSHKHSKLGRLA